MNGLEHAVQTMKFRYKCSESGIQTFLKSFMRVVKVMNSLIKCINGVSEGFMDGLCYTVSNYKNESLFCSNSQETFL